MIVVLMVVVAFALFVYIYVSICNYVRQLVRMYHCNSVLHYYFYLYLTDKARPVTVK